MTDCNEAVNTAAYDPEAIAVSAAEMAAVLCPSADRAALDLLCPLYARTVLSRVTTDEDCTGELTAAVAYLAAASAILGGEAEFSSAKVGEISITSGGSGSAALSAALRIEAERLLRPFVSDSGFAFMEVRG